MLDVVRPRWITAAEADPALSWVGPAWSRLVRPGIWYDEAAAEAAVGFFEAELRLTEAEWAGRPFRLQGWQAAIVRLTFGLKRQDKTRAIRRVLIWVPRKNGKTEFLAGLSLLALVGDGEFGGQGYAIAKDKDQAKIVFKKAAAMVGMSGTLSRHLQAFKTSIFCPQLNASFQPLSGNPDGKHGFSASFIAGDEMHEWPDERLYTFVHQSSAARRQPLEVLISTAGTRSRGHGWAMWQETQRILEGTVEDPETLCVVYGAAPEDDWNDEATWIKANPNIGVSPKWDYIRSEYSRAKDSPRLENDFRRYHLNQWTEQVTRWIGLDDWDACAGPVPWQQLRQTMRGRRCFAGLDLSSTSDLTAEVLLFAPEDPNSAEPIVVVPRFWVPAASIELRARRDQVPYDLWQHAGAVESTTGNVVDYGAVEEAILTDAREHELALLGYDPYNALASIQRLQAELGEEKVREVRQGYLTLSAPSKEFERLVKGRRFVHGGHPVLRWMVGNVAVATDPAGNIKPAKDKSTEKIDGVAALINALACWLCEPSEPGGPSFWETLAPSDHG